MNSERWKVAVVGPGGVGGLLGAVLTRAGNPVRYVATPGTAAALNAGGVTVDSAQFGTFHVPATAGTRLTEPVDLCVLAVKATALTDALDGLPADVLGDALILPLLNGVEHLEVLRRRYPAGQVLAGAIRVESTRTAPGRIAHTSPFSLIDVAGHSTPRARLDALAAELGHAGFEVTVRDGEAALLWSKLAFLAPLALLTTHAAAPVGTVLTDRRTDLDTVVAEVTAVASAAGAPVEQAGIRAMFDRLQAGMKSSMLRDAEAGRPTELDAIGGAVLRAAARHGVATPVTARLVADLRRDTGPRPAVS